MSLMLNREHFLIRQITEANNALRDGKLAWGRGVHVYARKMHEEDFQIVPEIRNV